jgi:hypothetical protein
VSPKRKLANKKPRRIRQILEKKKFKRNFEKFSKSKADRALYPLLFVLSLNGNIDSS